MAYDRIFNFSAGPATMPVEVLEEIAAEVLNYRGSGMSVMEMSHRSKVFQQIVDEAKKIAPNGDASALDYLQEQLDYAKTSLK